MKAACGISMRSFFLRRRFMDNTVINYHVGMTEEEFIKDLKTPHETREARKSFGKKIEENQRLLHIEREIFEKEKNDFHEERALGVAIDKASNTGVMIHHKIGDGLRMIGTGLLYSFGTVLVSFYVVPYLPRRVVLPTQLVTSLDPSQLPRVQFQPTRTSETVAEETVAEETAAGETAAEETAARKTPTFGSRIVNRIKWLGKKTLTLARNSGKWIVSEAWHEGKYIARNSINHLVVSKVVDVFGQRSSTPPTNNTMIVVHNYENQEGTARTDVRFTELFSREARNSESSENSNS
jgi:hypothetical protein